jgi:predicted phage terminase large subunit-like protein
MEKKRQLDAILRNNLSVFTRKVFHTVSPSVQFLPNWHLDLISDYLQACMNRDIKRLIINICPRYMKSIAVSTSFPSFLLGKDPSERIIVSSYAQELSHKLSTDTRLVIQSEWYQRLFPWVKIAEDQNTKGRFETTERGHRVAVSVGGMVTGVGGNVLICDDPTNPKQGQSETLRNTANKWFDQTFMSRLDDKKNGVVIVIQQRLHENDLSGHLLAKGGWEHLKIPFVAEEKTIVQFNGKIYKEREEGELLHPERESPDSAKSLERELGSYAYAGQYQQDPAPADGGIIKKAWIQYYEELPSFDYIDFSCDTAFKEKQDNDYSVIGVWGVNENGYYLIKCIRDKMAYNRLKQRLIDTYTIYKPRFILIEDKASGQSLIQDLTSTTVMPIKPIQVGTDKVTRCYSCQPEFENEKVFLPKTAEWVNDYTDELTKFPNAKHDDQVDMTTQYLNFLKSFRELDLWVA